MSFALCCLGVVGAWRDRRADREVTPDGVVRLLGNDGWFHARHARRLAHVMEANGSASDLLRTARLDGGCEFPLGLRTIHVSLFDLALAVGLRSSGVDLDDEPATRAVLAEAGPMGAALGGGAAALAALAVALALRRQLALDPRVGLVGVAAAPAAAALLARALPAHFENATRFGEVDHHHLEPTLLLLGLAASVAAAGVRTRMARVAAALALGAVLLTALFSWAGGVLIVGWVCAALVTASIVTIVTTTANIEDGGRSAATIVAGVVVAVLGFGATVVVQPLAVLHIVLRVPTLAILVCTAFVGVAAAVARGSSGSRLRQSPIVLRFVLVAGAGAVAAVVLDAAGVLDAAAPHFGARSMLVSEHQAVSFADIAARHQLSFGCAVVGCAAAVFTLVQVVRQRRTSSIVVDNDDGERALVGAVGLLVIVPGVVVTWAITHDHATMAAPVLAAAGGVGVATLVALVGMAVVDSERRWSLAIAAAVAVACALLGHGAPTLTGASAWT